MGNQTKEKPVQAPISRGHSPRKMALARVFAFALASSLLSVTPSQASGVGKYVEDVCKKSTDAAFRKKYCNAARGLQKGFFANIATSAVWAGVTTTCALACGSVVGGGACTVAKIAGSAGEGALTKKFTQSLMGEGANTLSKKTETAQAAEAATNTKKVNGDACLSAANSATKAVQKFSDSKSNKQNLSELRDDTLKMDMPENQQALLIGVNTQQIVDSNSNAGLQAAASGKNESCEERKVSTAIGAIRCAMENDPTIPSFVNSKEFLDDLQKATGKHPDAFFGGFSHPGEAIAGSAAIAALAPEQKSGIIESLAAMERYADMNRTVGKPSTEGYRSAGTSPTLESGNDFDVNAMLSGLLGAGNAPAEEEIGTTETMDFGKGASRVPAKTVSPEDRTISLFDRVQWRYGTLSAKKRVGLGDQK